MPTKTADPGGAYPIIFLSMPQASESLVSLLTLERLEEDRFRGPSSAIGLDHLYGGQLLGQSLSAAAQTVEPARSAHSLHGYFVHPGDASLPVDYAVDRVRDGSSFSTRGVTALQNGKRLFTLTASFHRPEEGFHHQLAMPEVPGPEQCSSELAQLRMLPPTVIESLSLKEKAVFARPIEIRPLQVSNPFEPRPDEPVKLVWFRAPCSLPDDPALHRALLAYASDFNLLTVSLKPHGVSWFTKFMQVASLDHSIWFHRDLRMDDWLLYAMDSPFSGHGRGFARGSIYNRAGELVAQVAQEGLIRRRDDRK